MTDEEVCFKREIDILIDLKQRLRKGTIFDRKINILNSKRGFIEPLKRL